MQEREFDLVIVGAGLVGLALARALSDSALRLAIVERQSTPAQAAPTGWDTRVYAISPGSENFLRGLQAWPQDASRQAAVTLMRVYGDRADSEIQFSAYQAHVARLATIVENRALQTALQESLSKAADLQWFRGAQGQSVETDQTWACLHLQDGTRLRAKLLVAADGADSWLRTQSEIATVDLKYDQSAIVANFETEHPHLGTAFQWFGKHGVLALLPLPGSRVSMVWSATQPEADRLASMDNAQLAREVAAASNTVLGDLQLIGEAASFPLRSIRPGRLIARRIALVGDAAHNLHPLAGQGMNLGFQDVRELADVLLARGHDSDVGAMSLLRRYERARREDVLLMTATTHGLQRLFSATGTPVAWIRNLGLNLTDRVSVLKSLFVRRAPPFWPSFIAKFPRKYS